VVLNWNGWRDTIKCVESLRHLDVSPNVLVVDNGSTDESVNQIRAAAPWVRLVLLATNRGFGGGMNAGIASALCDDQDLDFIWLLNNDTLVERHSLGRMIALAESDPKIGIVSNRLVDTDDSGRVQALGGGGLNRWLGTTSTYITPQDRACDHLIGASLLVKPSLLRNIGGFDERYFFFLEDTEFSMRARRSGWRLAVAKDATVFHTRGASIDRGSRVRSLRSDLSAARSSGIFVSGLDLPWRLTAVPLRIAGMLLNRLARAQVDRLLPVTQAYLDGLRIGRRPPVIPRFALDEEQSTIQAIGTETADSASARSCAG
jgi:hypothetical protein